VIEKVITRKPFDASDYAQDLAYWLSRPVEERIAAVEEMRRAIWGEVHVDRREFCRHIKIIREA
jgi:hypothetical protein